MLPYIPYFRFVKFLHDGGEVAFNGYIDKLIKIVKNWPLKKETRFELSHTKLYEEYIKKKWGKTPESGLSGYQGGPSHIVSSRWWYYPYPDVTFGVRFEVNFYMTKNPVFDCVLEPLPTEKNQAKELIVKTLSQGVADKISINEPAKERTTLGQLHWVYLGQKISLFQKLEWLYEKYSGDEPSQVYEFAQQIKVILLQDVANPLVELRELYPFNSKLSQTEREQRETADQKMLVEFFDKYDQILLNAWGKEKFSENLIPLGVSLDDWLKAGRD